MAAVPFQAGLHSPHLCGPYAATVVGPEVKDASPTGLQVYCDLDGVLADFNKGCLELFPEGGIIAEKIPTHLVTKLTWEEETEMWRRVEETSGDLPAVNGEKSDFFLSLDWTSDGEELWRWIDWNVVPSPAILTGLPMGRAGQMASKQKDGESNKQKFSGPNCILIDDRGDLREAWEARGGLFIHHTSAAESIRQLREALNAFHRSDRSRPGEEKSPPERLHRRNVLTEHTWCSFATDQRLLGCADTGRAAFKGQNDQMDEQSQGAFRKMLETLRECCELGLPLTFLQDHQGTQSTQGTLMAPSPLPPLPWQVKQVHEKMTEFCVALVQFCLDLDEALRSDLDLVLCCEVEATKLLSGVPHLWCFHDIHGASQEAVAGS
ncbi:unnamed protein product [Durusdinium trenchii]|uniref:Protein-serine/threonine phosphatase n=1 Tax=Durusdinium trenchii TaxID=1381693 RepID=A0ABP0MS91_9DINO